MSTGFVIPPFETIRTSVVARWKLAFGQNADTSSDSVDGLMIDIITANVYIGYEGIAESYNQHQLGTATDLNIDALIQPLFLIDRLQATPSTCEVQLYGTAGTIIPAISSVSTVDTGASFETTALVTIAATTAAVFVFPALTVPTLITVTIGAQVTPVTTSGAAVDVALAVSNALLFNLNVIDSVQAGVQPDGQAIIYTTMTSTWAFSIVGAGTAYDATTGFTQAQNTGPTIANYGTITRIGTPTTGWFGLTNLVDATLGTNEETDAAYKARHALAVQGRGNATPRGLAGKLRALQGVATVKIYQNTSGFPDAGRPSHSFEAVVDGGASSDIAETIWLSHTTGTQSWGGVSYIVTDLQGLVAQPRLIQFSRPNYRYIHVRLDITPGEGFPLIPLTDIQAMVGQAIETWGNKLGIGRDVYTYEVGVQTGKVLEGIQSIVVNLASTPTPFGAPSFGTSDLVMAELDYARFASTRIQVVIV